MRLISLLSLIESQLAPREVGQMSPWQRRASYHNGRAILWHPEDHLSLEINDCELSNGRHSLTARWFDHNGQPSEARNFYCQTSTEWRNAARTIGSLCPSTASADAPGTDRSAARARPTASAVG